MTSRSPSDLPLLSQSEYQSLCRKDFGFFMVEAFKEMHANEAYEDCSQQRYLCSLLTGVFDGTHKRLCLNLPPRSLKSFVVSVAFPAWVLGKWPSANFICVSYGADLAETFASHFLTLVQSQWYQDLFKLRLKREKVADIATHAGGSRISTGIDGGYFGRGADFIIIDDPTKPEDALSDARREEVNRIVDTKLRTRLDVPAEGRIVLAQQRQHVADLTGHLTAKEAWTMAVFPAIAEGDEYIPFHTVLGNDLHSRVVGESLQPGRMPIRWLKEQAAQMGTVAFQAQYQQRPMPPGGNIIKEAWIHRYGPADEPSSFDYLIQSWDTASTVGQASAYTVCMTFGAYQKKLYLLGCQRQQLEFPALQQAIKMEWERYSQRPCHVLIEDKSSGIALIQVAKRIGIPVIGIKPKESKDVRLQIVSPLIENGTLLFPRHTPWVDSVLFELTGFPQTTHCDQVDALSQALAWFQKKIMMTAFEFDFGYQAGAVWCAPGC